MKRPLIARYTFMSHRLLPLMLAMFLSWTTMATAQPGTISTIAGTSTSGFNGDGVPATTAQLAFPHGVFVDGSGNLFIADFGNHRVRRVDAATGLISTVAGTGTFGFNGDGVPATTAQLAFPHGVFVDGSGNLFIADFSNHRVRKVEAENMDSDGDGVLDTDDNCPSVANTDQADLDGDGVGDVCDTELSIDGATATLGAMVDDLGLKTGLKNALQAKLVNALSSFLAGNLGAAANQLSAFINQVNAKRGKPLSDSETDALIAAAQATIDAINGVSADKRSVFAGVAGSELPDTVILGQNYPNPFNPQTTIRFDLPESAQVTLSVFDIVGREVKVLVNGTVSAGIHEATFDASSLPSGTYIYQLTTPEGKISKMMLLLK